MSQIYRFDRLQHIWRAFLDENESTFLNASCSGEDPILGQVHFDYEFEGQHFIANLFERHINTASAQYLGLRLYFPNNEFLVPPFFNKHYIREHAPEKDDMKWQRQLGWDILDHQDPSIDALFSPMFDFGETWMARMRQNICSRSVADSCLDSTDAPNPYFKKISYRPLSAAYDHPAGLQLALNDPNRIHGVVDSSIVYNIFFNIELGRIDVQILCPEIARELVLSFEPEYAYYM